MSTSVYGDDDDWVGLGSDINSNVYYNSSSIKIDKQSKIIKVWVKRVFTGNEILRLNQSYTNINLSSDIIKNVTHSFTLFVINYKEMVYSIINLTHHSNSELLYEYQFPYKWITIMSGSFVDKLRIKLLLYLEETENI
jgi:hypothetical protein